MKKTSSIDDAFEDESASQVSTSYVPEERRRLALEESARSKLEKLYEDKSLVSTSSYEIIGDKEEGASAGKVGRRNEKVFMMKPVASGKVTDSLEVGDKDDMIAESMTGDLYKRFLHDRAPTIGLANSPVEGLSTEWRDKVVMTSEFLDDFQNINKSGLKTASPAKLNKVNGFEKAVAVSLFLGDNDFHGENLGVVRKTSDEGLEQYNVVKIDHGRSRSFPANEKELRRGLAQKFERWGYNTMPMDVNKLMTAIDGINTVSGAEIENIVKSSSYRLKRTGLEINSSFAGKSMRPSHDPQDPNKTISSYELLENFYIDRVQKQKQVFQEFRDNLETISKIDIEPAWKKGAWIQTIKDKDPIVWARENNRTIEGKDPIVWARENHKTIEGKSPDVWLEGGRNAQVGKAEAMEVVKTLRSTGVMNLSPSRTTGKRVVSPPGNTTPEASVGDLGKQVKKWAKVTPSYQKAGTSSSASVVKEVVKGPTDTPKTGLVAQRRAMFSKS